MHIWHLLMRMLSSQQRWRSYASDESLDTTMGIRIKNDTNRMNKFSKANANSRILDLMERCYPLQAAAAVLVVAGERRRISWVLVAADHCHCHCCWKREEEEKIGASTHQKVYGWITSYPRSCDVILIWWLLLVHSWVSWWCCLAAGMW